MSLISVLVVDIGTTNSQHLTEHHKSMSLCSVSKIESDSSNSIEGLSCDALNSVINDLSVIVGMCFHFHSIQTQ